MLPLIKQKLEVAAKEWTDNKMFPFRDDLLQTRLGEKYFLWEKTFQGNK